MKLHEFEQEFRQLISIVARQKHISESAVDRDYYIVMMLQKLEQSEYGDKCVFKGGTSLSKCYPGSIERFSEDIDLTFLAMELGIESDKKCEKALKKIESIMSDGAKIEVISDGRNARNKPSYVWYGDEESQIKLEIGSTVRPDPYSKKEIKTYIQEYLEGCDLKEDIELFELKSVWLNVLDISRTFIDKIMAVKRHAYGNELVKHVRHIYDVYRLISLSEIQDFLKNTSELKRLIILTKETDHSYLSKRPKYADYDPVTVYDFDSWCDKFDSMVRDNYEHLHEELLYTDEKQDFDKAIETFRKINSIFAAIGE